MPKPTEEIIECAYRLRTLGVKKDPEIGDWFIPEDPNDRWCCLVNNENDKHHISFLGHIIIPPLEWCLEWLRDRGLESLTAFPGSNGEWICKHHTGGYFSRRALVATTPHLAVLKAIIAVAKEKQ